MSGEDQAQRRAVLLTPSGRGAVATLRVEGPGATAALAACFRSVSGRILAEQPMGRIHLGLWQGRAARDEDAPAGEEVLLVRHGPEAWELHCHGGTMASAAIQDDLAAAGFPPWPWVEWARGTEADPLRAAARIALAGARTQRAAAILLDQHEGALQRALAEIASLCDTQPALAAARIASLLAWAPVGLKLAPGWKVVLAGLPNVGKSSLMNALIGYERSIVFDQPGTTRDVLTAPAAFAGWPVTLCDTAGLRAAGDSLEAAGVERARRELATADLIVWVSDATEPAPWRQGSGELASSTARLLKVRNKWDLVADQACRPESDGLAVSARTGQGLAELVQAIGAALVPNPPPQGAAVPFTEEQVASLIALREQCEWKSGHR